jgi:hypothetical protein
MEILDKMEASTTIEMNALEHLGGYNLSLIRERVYSARIRDTEAKLLRKRKFSYLPNVEPWRRIQPLQISIFCQSSIPMIALPPQSHRFEFHQPGRFFNRPPEGFELVID